MAIVTMRNETRDQDGEAVQIFIVKMPVFRQAKPDPTSEAQPPSI
jgi:hypothetical protein